MTRPTHTTTLRSLFLGLLLPLLTPAAAQLAETDTTFHLNEVVVTGTRTPKLLGDAPIQTRVITSRDIERTDATDVQP